MTRVDFYHLQKHSLEEVLPKLLLKSYATKNNILVKVGTFERVEFINSLLWTFSDESFLPHGSKRDGFAEQQPVWLTSDENNPNNATYLFLVDGAEIAADNAANYERLFNIFDGNSSEAVQQSREMWRRFKQQGFELHYWQQGATGTWEDKT